MVRAMNLSTPPTHTHITRLIFKQSTTDLNSVFPFPRLVAYYLHKARGGWRVLKKRWIHAFPSALVQMQTALSKI